MKIDSCGVYEIRNLTNNKIYIGRSKNIDHRIWQHKSDLRNHEHDNSHLQSAWNKYGEDSFEFNIIVEIHEDCLVKAEQYWLDKFKSYISDNGYNKDQDARFGGSNGKGSDSPVWNGGKVKLNCKNCGEAFKVFPNKKDKRSYCSRKCMADYFENNSEYNGKNHPSWQGGDVVKVCEFCEEDFSVSQYRKGSARFCSRDCLNKFKKETSKNKGENHHNAILDIDEVKEIKKLLNKSNLTYREIGNRFGVEPHVIGKIKRGESWTNIQLEGNESAD